MKGKPNVSIIVPVYKAENCITRCIETILQQSFREWELLLIDDGSPDGSGTLCDQFARIDDRIKTYHKENGGVSSARNLGLEYAQGEYVTFIDADDYVKGDYLGKMVACEPADLIICGFTNADRINFRPESVNYSELKNHPFLTTLFKVPYYLDTPWCKLFKREILRQNKLCFDRKLKLSEDTLFCYEYVTKIRSIHVLSDTLYIYDGKWGGGTKYQLTWDELSYMAERITAAIKEVNNTFGVKIDNRFKGFHANKLLNIFSEYQDYQLYNLYCKYYNDISIGEFLGDSRSPLAIGLLTAEQLAAEGNREDSTNLLRNIKRFTTTPVSDIRFCSKQLKWAGYALEYLGAVLTVLLFIFKKNMFHAKNSIC